MLSRNTSAIHPLAARLASLMELSQEELSALNALPTQVVSTVAGQPILRAGDPPLSWLLVLEGFVSTSKNLGDGKCQILSFHLPGDMPVLMARPDQTLDADVIAVSAGKLASLEFHTLLGLCRRFPRVGELLWECARAMVSVYCEWIVNVGHRPATSRLAHLLCEIMIRLEALGLARDGACDLPLTQVHLSQATGLSRIHVNRSCQELRRRGLMSLEHGQLTIYDWKALARLGQFSPEYLHLPAPRWIGSPRWI